MNIIVLFLFAFLFLFSPLQPNQLLTWTSSIITSKKHQNMWPCMWPHLSSTKHVFENPSLHTHTQTQVYTHIWIKRAIHGGRPILANLGLLFSSFLFHAALMGFNIQGVCMCDDNRCVLGFAGSNEGLDIWGKLWSEHRGQLSLRGEERWKRGKNKCSGPVWVKGGFYEALEVFSNFES